jgi:superfamily I DNA/RNA helicase
MTPSKYQTAIYDWVENGKGNCIVNACAGSGKSTVALQSANYMIGDIIFFAFNKKIQTHLDRKLSSMGLPNARAATFHSEGLKNLIKSKGRVKVENSKLYYITEKYCQSPELNAARPFIQKLVNFAKEYAFGVKDQRSIDDTQAWIDIIQTQDISLDADCDFFDVIEIAKDVLRESNRDFRTIDFADMVYLPLFYDIQCNQYDWVIVDEAQDTNVSRKIFISKILKSSGRLLMIGDENQSIYAFCGAENNSMEILKDMFNCASFPLSICYRCGKNIIVEAQKLQPHIEAFDGNPDGEIIDMKYDDFLTQVETMNLTSKDGIICRNNAPNVAFAFALIRKGIGCRIEGRDIGQNLISLCNKWRKINDLNEFTQKLVLFFEKEFEKASRVKMQLLEDKLQTMVILIERCQSLGKNDVNSLKSLIESMFTDNGDPKNADLVTLSSIHKGKGLEWERCFLLGNSQLIPSKYAVTESALSQETNLNYISITRASKTLVRISDIPVRGNRNVENE